jgi:hypothetical protein
MFVLADSMNSKKLLPVGLALLLCTSVVVASVSLTALGQQQTNASSNQNTTGTNTINDTGTSTAGALNCDRAASVLRGLILPSPAGICDIAVPLQGLQVQDTATGATLNKLLVINPLFEFLPVSNQTTASGNQTAVGGGNQTTVYGFAEFALLEGQLPLAMRMLSNSSWNVVAVHNHVVGESPSMIFAHAIAHGDINTLGRDARTILDSLTTQMQSLAGNQTSTTAGGDGTGTTSGGGGGTTGGSANTTSGGGIGTDDPGSESDNPFSDLT